MPTATKRATGCALSDRHLKDLESSGLNGDTINRSLVYTETDPAIVGKLLGWSGPATVLGSCLVFPFFDADGNRATYSRVKPDRPRPDEDGKPGEYESPMGRGSLAYMPALARENRVNVGRRLIITEGEKKALAADQYGYACVGLVGAWGWQVKRETDDEPRVLIPDLDQFAWEGRTVYVVLDSDALYKPDVRWSEWHLAKILTERKATVRVVRLPARLGRPKVGLDDFLLARGPGKFDALLQSARPASEPSCDFSNFVERPNPDKPGDTFEEQRAVAEIAAELVGRAGGWPRSVGGVLVVPDAAGGVRSVDTYHQLFAFAGSVFDAGGVSRVRWSQARGSVSPRVLLEHLRAECERFDRADPLPHVPPIASVLYTCPPAAADGTGEALKAFLDFFAPATKTDCSLLTACLLTLLWGGPPGKRPAFLFEAEEGDAESGRGVGKSTVAQKFAAVFGGAFDIDPGEPFARTRSRLLTPEAGGYRVLLMDNVKTFRLSSADLESLITNPNINGHRLYHGQAGTPNYYTLFITMNGASLSRDAAQRVVPVRLSRAEMRAGWEAEVDKFIADRRGDLIADLAAVLRGKRSKLSRVSRWGVWESEVLARVANPNGCMDLIEERTRNMDADGEDAERIRETLIEVLYHINNKKDAHQMRFLLNSAAVTKLVSTAINDRYIAAASASAAINALGVKGFRKSDRKGQRRWLWTGDRFGDSNKPVGEMLQWNPDAENWHLTDLKTGKVTNAASSSGSDVGSGWTE